MDLSAIMFYKAKFSIQERDPEKDLLWSIVLHLRKWLLAKWNHGDTVLPPTMRVWSNIKYGGRIISPKKDVYIESEYFKEDEGEQYWACMICEQPAAPRGMAPRKWTTEIGFRYDMKNPATVSVVLSYEDLAGFIGPYQNAPKKTIPKLVRNIVDDPNLIVTVGSDLVTGRPTELKVGDWPALRDRILDEERQLPYIYLSPCEIDTSTHESAVLMDPFVLADTLYGNAKVYFSRDIEYTQEVSYMDSEYACYNGAIKVYQPPSGTKKGSVRLRTIGAEEVIEKGPEAITEYFIRAFAQNVHFYDTFFRLEDCHKKKLEYVTKTKLKEQVQHYRAQLAKVKTDAEQQVVETETQALSFLEDEEERRIQAETDRDRYKALYEDAKSRIFSLEALNDEIQNALAENEGLRRSTEARMLFSELPNDINSVYRYFSEVFADKILFTESAIKSFRSCTLDAAELWKVFYALVTVMLPLYKNGSGDIHAAFRQKTGIESKRGEGSLTRRDRSLMRQFEVTVGDEEIDIEAHITYARRGQSIHFGYSLKRDSIVIGHCGAHLDNATTRKVR